MSRATPVESEIIDPSSLDPVARQRLIAELYATHQEIFAGVSEREFAAYVVDSPAERTRIQVLRAGGRVVGYLAVHTFVRELDGERWVVLRAESGKLPAYRRCADASLMIAEILRMCLRHPGARKAMLGCFVHPSAYLALGRVAAEVYPHPERPTPPTTRRIMDRLADAFGLAPIGEAGGGVREVGWITRESPAEQAALARRDDPWTRLYLRENPGYRAGSGLVVLLPISPGNWLGGVLLHARRVLARRFGWVAAKLDGAVAADGR